jgi:phage terminase small subunit
VTADWVIDELRKLACANMADYMKSTPDGGVVLDFAGLTRDQTAALSQVKVSGDSVTFKLNGTTVSGG